MTQRNSLSRQSMKQGEHIPVFGESDEGSPTSDMIVWDIKKTVESMKTIYEHDGTTLQGLGNRGKRMMKTGGRGGPRRKKPFSACTSNWIHPDAVEARQRLMENITSSIRTLNSKPIIPDKKIMEDDDSSMDVSNNEVSEPAIMKVLV
eukprot:CAMPEP_0172487932 /NCGR_PEP_ID=MMETSP1066-20121228/17236_1 /TAXON_ID=671091 /ORGANISM="Coscinodiscus wailesii, Strain CCMP2513" /LENGTH=147 /DNA_ID=CAMNT_0013254843 /DNA_START=118 /DNA_END=560 /DNA_ORIENTATION=-